MADPNAYFKKGAPVEISSDEPDFRGAWFIGTVINRSRSKQKNHVFVEYTTLMSDQDQTKFLREKVDIIQLRPPAPREKERSFRVGEEVDAYHLDGWWEGVVTRINQQCGGDPRFTVYFRGTREELDFSAEELRLHREWVRGEWVPPLEKEDGDKFASNTDVEEPSKNTIEELVKGTFAEVTNGITNVEEPCINIAENFGKGTSVDVASDNANVEEPCIDGVEKFGKGTLVEVTSDEDGFQGAWFAATILEKLSNDEFLVEYQSLTNDDGTELLKEKANIKHIRPFPPETAVAGYYSLLQEVDALYNDGWWVGVVSKVLQSKKYFIYFRGTNEELEFDHSDLRPHQDLIDGKWVVASKALKL